MSHDAPKKSMVRTDSKVQEAIDRLLRGDSNAKEELLGYARKQLVLMTRKRLRGNSGFPKVGRWMETDDVTQLTMIRLLKAFDASPVNTVGEFYALAARHIRYELINLKHYLQAKWKFSEGWADRSGADGKSDIFTGATSRDELEDDLPDFLLEIFDSLPADQQRMLNLVYYNGLPHEDAAAEMGVHTSTFDRAWRTMKAELAARLRTSEAGEKTVP